MAHEMKFMEDWKNDSKLRKQNNRKYALDLLNRKSIGFTEHNNGVHLIVEESIDYWPTTGKWIVRKSGKQGRGINNLIREIENFEHL